MFSGGQQVIAGVNMSTHEYLVADFGTTASIVQPRNHYNDSGSNSNGAGLMTPIAANMGQSNEINIDRFRLRRSDGEVRLWDSRGRVISSADDLPPFVSLQIQRGRDVAASAQGVLINQDQFSVANRNAAGNLTSGQYPIPNSGSWAGAGFTQAQNALLVSGITSGTGGQARFAITDASGLAVGDYLTLPFWATNYVNKLGGSSIVTAVDASGNWVELQDVGYSSAPTIPTNGALGETYLLTVTVKDSGGGGSSGATNDLVNPSILIDDTALIQAG